MNTFSRYTLLLLVLGLSACGGSSDEGGSNTSGDSSETVYEGIWYSAEYDAYLAVDYNNIEYRTCDFYNGYVIDDNLSVSISEDVINYTYGIEEAEFDLVFVDDNLVEQFDGDTVDTYTKVTNVSSTCLSDGIEFVDITPISVTDGELVNVTVNLDYRITSADSGMVVLGYASDPDDYSFVDNSVITVAASSSISSASITITFTPEKIEDSNFLELVVVLATYDEEQNLIQTVQSVDSIFILDAAEPSSTGSDYGTTFESVNLPVTACQFPKLTKLCRADNSQ